MLFKIILSVILVFGYSYLSSSYLADLAYQENAEATNQLNADNAKVSIKKLSDQHKQRNNIYMGGWIVILAVILGIFMEDIRKLFSKLTTAALIFMALMTTGCWRPFEPVKLEVINSTEEAFMLPYLDGVDKQSSTHTEDFLRKNLVHTQQVKIPQQWVPKGYETFRANGEWRDTALLIKVDKSPVTREWTADPNSGTSAKNEAIWVMTSDQVEFSTGWTCTARIASRDDAVKFLYNYPNGSLERVMDGEVRAKIQTEFGIEVTDLPMTELRLKATPHIVRVVEEVKSFFLERGITITNLGITGGFVYKDPTIIATMVKVFNAEQEKAIASAGAAAQSETNKKIQLEADAKAKAAITVSEAEATSIKTIADAKAYEIEKSKQDITTYLMLKHIELEKGKLEKWDGKFPTYFMGGVEGLNLLLQSPKVDAK